MGDEAQRFEVVVVVDNSAFISYRRESAYPWARLIWDELQERSCNVFLDLETMRGAGRFDKRILNQIAARPYFLMLLTEGTLDRCSSEADWVRREIEHAIDTDRIIVPLYIAPFEPSHFPVDTPPRIAETLANSNGVTFYSQFLQAALDQLADLLQPVALPQVALTEDDVRFEEHALHSVRSEPPPELPSTSPLPVAPVVEHRSESSYQGAETSRPAVRTGDQPVVNREKVGPDPPPGPPRVEAPGPEESDVQSETMEPRAATTTGERPVVDNSRRDHRQRIALAAVVIALLIGGAVGLTLAFGGDAEDGAGDDAPTTGVITDPPDSAEPDGSRLTTVNGNAIVREDDPVVSDNGRHELLMTDGGQLVLRTDGDVVWQPVYPRPAVPGAVAVLQEVDGNFVVYRSEAARDPLWSINEQPGRNVELRVLDDGFVAVFDQAGGQVWRRPGPATADGAVSPDENDPTVEPPPSGSESDPEITVGSPVFSESQQQVTFPFENAGSEPGSVGEVTMDVISAGPVDLGVDQGAPPPAFDLGGPFETGDRCTFDATDLGWSEIPPTEDGVESRSLTLGGVSLGDLSDVPETFAWTMELRFAFAVGDAPGDIVETTVTVSVRHDPAGDRAGRVVPDCG